MINFKCKKFYIETKRVKLPNGQAGEFSTLIKRHGSNVIPIMGDGTILLALQYRPSVKKMGVSAYRGEGGGGRDTKAECNEGT
jgi:hypothetical protein